MRSPFDDRRYARPFARSGAKVRGMQEHLRMCARYVHRRVLAYAHDNSARCVPDTDLTIRLSPHLAPLLAVAAAVEAPNL